MFIVLDQCLPTVVTHQIKLLIWESMHIIVTYQFKPILSKLDYKSVFFIKVREKKGKKDINLN